jgi:hypothetical protein
MSYEDTKCPCGGKKEREIMDQLPLDFEGTDPEQILRCRWAENTVRERAFWTPERLCLSWMQGTTPDESDMAWWDRQPTYHRRQWLYLHDKAKSEARAEKRSIRAFHLVSAEFDEAVEIRRRADESMIARFESIIREDFKLGRGCSIDLSNCGASERWQSEYRLEEAIRRAGIPAACIAHT